MASAMASARLPVSLVTMTPTYPAQREQRRVRDVQDAQQSIDEGQAKRNQGVDRALDEALYRQIEEEHGSKGRRRRLRGK